MKKEEKKTDSNRLVEDEHQTAHKQLQTFTLVQSHMLFILSCAIEELAEHKSLTPEIKKQLKNIQQATADSLYYEVE